MIIKNKKALGLQWYLLIVAFVLGIVAYYVDFYFAPHKIIDNYIGQYQFSILNAANKAESALLYIDQSAKYALQQALYELAKNGGYILESDTIELGTNQPFVDNECGEFQGNNIWYEVKKDASGDNTKKKCFDGNSLTANTLYYFDGNLNKYITSSPYDIPLDSYDYKVSNNLEIAGKAYLPIKFNILKEEKPVIKQPSEFKSTAQENFVDFTGTKLCAKGRACLLMKEAYDLLLKAQEIADKYHVTLQVTYGYRTLEDQTRLWQKNPNSKLVCRPNPSCPHLSGKAVDVVLKEKTDWQLLYKIMAEAGWVLYAQKGDEHHFECCGTDRYSRAKAQGVTAIK